jgi:hypothetical protein
MGYREGAAPVTVMGAAEGDVAAFHGHKGLAVRLVECPGELLDEEVQLNAVREVLCSPPANQSLLQHQPLPAPPPSAE